MPNVWIRSYRSNRSRVPKHSSSSVVLEKRVQAVKANVALRLAEQEQWRRFEGEIKLLEIEKKHRELLRQQKMEKENIERTQRLETLRQQSERELAEARQRVALMDLEAELEEQMEEQGEIDMSLVTQDQENIPTGADQFTGDIPRPFIYEDFLFENEPHPTMRNNSLNPDLSAKPLYSTPVMTASSP
ncbi:---NA--- [Paramuricea clavata]|uniref:---NA n=1 Tax=Paramuricea clavata TaxID=317549 RepID=A0A6S7G9W4_PARCT|nr:---NA--- [Paramuricea clavata]